MLRPFLQVDVFGSAPFSGNPLAVVAGAEGLSTEQMQSFARWANLSESVFLLPPKNSTRRLPGADLHAGSRAALRRSSDAGRLPRLAGERGTTTAP